MSRLIDADKLKSYFAPTITGRTEYSADEILLTIATMPTVEQPQINATENMVEIVWCENCKHYEEETWTCLFHGANVRPRDYCSRGEKDEN